MIGENRHHSEKVDEWEISAQQDINGLGTKIWWYLDTLEIERKKFEIIGKTQYSGLRSGKGGDGK
jgi:hypothetical protein